MADRSYDDPRGGAISLRRLVFVFFLVLMLSTSPGLNPQAVRVERARVEYVTPRRRRRDRLRGRPHGEHTPRPLRFVSIESFHSLQDEHTHVRAISFEGEGNPWTGRRSSGVSLT
jgi:hypothetical protein